MALTQYPAARFFSAFHRWNHLAQRQRSCTRTACHYTLRQSTCIAARSFSSTRYNGHGLPRKEEDKPRVQRSMLQEQVRQIMRRVPHPVVVITAAHFEPELDRQVPLGIAVSSFNTVTLKPPTVSFNIKCPSRTLDAIRADQGRFRVHVLESSPLGAQAAQLFTAGNTTEMFLKRSDKAEKLISTRNEEMLGPNELDESAIAALDCTLSYELGIRDHIIAVATVRGSVVRDTETAALSYKNGQYLIDTRDSS
ncbi:hypothetical protein EJ04DRAFT_80560 [Polyplosphaeria fusca]|uniref:Flavin reductase like domain-containing protein n=1 Tax=Polyplosphaeria fusca TaxID=682080 RepID=A0A9P4R4J6_9PLEO|nr:hypothetical protein EJ04DRAFT_80560 [Polyplosphaeria fusca]